MNLKIEGDFTEEENNRLKDICSELETSMNVKFSKVIDVKIFPKPQDSAWYVASGIIMLDSDQFFKLDYETQKLTISHECAHHIINNNFTEEYLKKYGNKLDNIKESQGEALADYIVNYELGFDILRIRDNHRKNDVEFVKNLLNDAITNEDVHKKANDLLS